MDGAVLLLSVVACCALIMAFMSQFISPGERWIFSTMGLLAPTLYVVNVVLALYWIIRWSWRIAIPIMIVLAIGANRVTLIVKMPLSKEYNTQSYRNTVKIMSFNMHGMRDDKLVRTTDQIVDYIIEESPDIICAQEVSDKLLYEPLNTRRKYHKYIYGSLGIYSRYPIINSRECFDSKDWYSGSSAYADVVIKGDTIRIFNNHLHSTRITKSDNKYLTSSMIVRDSNRTEHISNIVSRLQNNSVERSEQARLLRAEIERSPYRVIVCGDFNETPISYTYNTISKGLKDAFQVCGNNYSYTYRGFYNMLRIDYILMSPSITPLSYWVDESILLSDHLPIVVRVQINK